MVAISLTFNPYRVKRNAFVFIPMKFESLYPLSIEVFECPP